jgi:hypothetical protein
MARSLNSPKINLKLSGSLVNTLADGSSQSTVTHPSWNFSKSLTSGVSANQANRAWQETSGSIANGAQETISLADFAGKDIGGGIGNDALGQAMDLEEIVCIAIVNENLITAAGVLEILPANSEGWDPIGIHTVALGGALRGQGALVKVQLAEAGFDVTGTNNHRITLKANGGPVSYSMYVLGRHDDGESSSSSQSSSSSSVSSSSESSSVSTSSVSTSSSSQSTSSSSQSSSSQSSSSESSSSSISESSSSLSS